MDAFRKLLETMHTEQGSSGVNGDGLVRSIWDCGCDEGVENGLDGGVLMRGTVGAAKSGLVSWADQCVFSTPYEECVIRYLDTVFPSRVWKWSAVYNYLSVGDLVRASHGHARKVKHSCMAKLMDAFFDDLVPHGTSATDIPKFYGDRAIRGVVAQNTSARVGVVSVASKGTVHVEHVVLLPNDLPVGDFVVNGMAGDHMAVMLKVRVLALRDLFAEMRSGECGVGCNPLWVTTGNCNGTCGIVSDPGKHLCPDCKCTVVTAGHAERCTPVAVAATSFQKRAALLGDVLHRLDVVTAVLCMDVSDSERTPEVTKYVQGAAQARWWWSNVGREDLTESQCATLFEANYLRVRKDYLGVTFPSVPWQKFHDFMVTEGAVLSKFQGLPSLDAVPGRGLGRVVHPELEGVRSVTQAIRKVQGAKLAELPVSATKSVIEMQRKRLRQQKVFAEVILEESSDSDEVTEANRLLDSVNAGLGVLNARYKVAPTDSARVEGMAVDMLDLASVGKCYLGMHPCLAGKDLGRDPTKRMLMDAGVPRDYDCGLYPTSDPSVFHYDKGHGVANFSSLSLDDKVGNDDRTRWLRESMSAVPNSTWGVGNQDEWRGIITKIAAVEARCSNWYIMTTEKWHRTLEKVSNENCGSDKRYRFLEDRLTTIKAGVDSIEALLNDVSELNCNYIGTSTKLSAVKIVSAYAAGSNAGHDGEDVVEDEGDGTNEDGGVRI